MTDRDHYSNNKYIFKRVKTKCPPCTESRKTVVPQNVLFHKCVLYLKKDHLVPKYRLLFLTVLFTYRCQFDRM